MPRHRRLRRRHRRHHASKRVSWQCQGIVVCATATAVVGAGKRASEQAGNAKALLSAPPPPPLPLSRERASELAMPRHHHLCRHRCCPSASKQSSKQAGNAKALSSALPPPLPSCKRVSNRAGNAKVSSYAPPPPLLLPLRERASKQASW
jgi:hypothetical protein